MNIAMVEVSKDTIPKIMGIPIGDGDTMVVYYLDKSRLFNGQNDFIEYYSDRESQLLTHFLVESHWQLEVI